MSTVLFKISFAQQYQNLNILFKLDAFFALTYKKNVTHIIKD